MRAGRGKEREGEKRKDGRKEGGRERTEKTEAKKRYEVLRRRGRCGEDKDEKIKKITKKVIKENVSRV